MPIHDWTHVSAGIYHNFHQDWTIEICRTLNRGVLPEGYYAMADQRVSGPEPDVIALRFRGPGPSGGLAVAEAPPRILRGAQVTIETSRYALKANRIVVREELGRVVAMIEVVSPGNQGLAFRTRLVSGQGGGFRPQWGSRPGDRPVPGRAARSSGACPAYLGCRLDGPGGRGTGRSTSGSAGPPAVERLRD